MAKKNHRNNALLEDFEIYLKSVDQLGDGSKGSYISYLNSLCEHTLDSFAEEIYENEITFIELFYAIKQVSRMQFLPLAENYLNCLKEKNNTSLKKKTLANYFSGFKWFMYMAFEADGQVKKIKAANIGAIQKTIEQRYKSMGRVVYSKKQINDIYIARLKTQDREYAEIGFPIRVIWKLATRENIEKQILNAMKKKIDEMEYYVSPDGKKTIAHKKIKEFVLNIQEDCVKINGETMFTEKYMEKDGEKREYVKQKPIMARISIDHKDDLHGMLTGRNVKSYPYLKRLSDDMKGFSYTCKNTKAAKAVEFFNARQGLYDKAFVELLVKEVCCLFEAMQFVAMDKNQNSSKNAKR